jgi:hypothetical protein
MKKIILTCLLFVFGFVGTVNAQMDPGANEVFPGVFINEKTGDMYDENGNWIPKGDSVPVSPSQSAGLLNQNSSGSFSGSGSNGGTYNPGISGACRITNIDSIAGCATTIINTILYFLMSGALLYTVWAAFKLVKDGDSADGRSEARQQIIAGIIALVVMSSVWGLVAILSTTFGLTNRTPVEPPQIRLR